MAKLDFKKLARRLTPESWNKPDHPMGSVEEAQALLATLPFHDPLASLNEIIHWLESVAAEQAFSAGRRARLVMLLDQAARPLWRELAQEYLAPDGVPRQGKEGDPKLLGRFSHLAQELATSYQMVFKDGIPDSDWAQQNAALLLTRWVRALTQCAGLRRMLREPIDNEAWSTLNRALEMARLIKVDRTALAAYEGERRLTCVRQEYIRAALFSIAAPESLKVRDTELVLRIAGRFAASVQLTDTQAPTSTFGIDLANANGPVAIERLDRKGDVLFLNTDNCIAQMRKFADAGHGDAGDVVDTQFGSEFAARERSRMLKHALTCWGANPPKRKSDRIAVDRPARIATGLVMAIELCGKYDQGGFSIKEDGLRIQFEDKKGAAKLAAERIQRERPGTLMDESASGLGVALPYKATSWARIGALVSVFVQPGPDWVVCAARRVAVRDETLSLGLQVLARKPRSAWLRVLEHENENVWDDAMRKERNFDTHFVRALLLSDPPQTAAVISEMLLPIGRARAGSGFDLPLGEKVLRLSVLDVREGGEDYVRVRFRWKQTMSAAAGS